MRACACVVKVCWHERLSGVVGAWHERLSGVLGAYVLGEDRVQVLRDGHERLRAALLGLLGDGTGPQRQPPRAKHKGRNTQRRRVRTPCGGLTDIDGRLEGLNPCIDGLAAMHVCVLYNK